jgi:diguanylate cyclase (GGDEF)-like protein/putative nucleotidyltransferase with HDIG domain
LSLRNTPRYYSRCPFPTKETEEGEPGLLFPFRASAEERETKVNVRAFVRSTIAIGATCLLLDLFPFETTDPLRFLTYFVMSALAAGLRVSLPTVSGTLSINFLFVLIGFVHLSRSETIILGCTAAVIQCMSIPERTGRLSRALFNMSVTAIAIHVSYLVYRAMPAGASVADEMFRQAPAALALFLFHTVPVAIAMAWLEGRRVSLTWRENSLWSVPYALAGAGVAGCFAGLSQKIGWQLSLLVLPVVYLITRSYQLHIARVDDGLRHAEELAGLHLRTIEALALAIEAKDTTTANHLERVQTYAIEIGRIMRISDDELEALRAAALLHDIGKLAVPEHILSKPGRLTPDEFEKMKIHPIVGADIIERANFPYPVAPIVRSHHERWNGEGYPDGIRGTAIPIGARILSAVDCFDALSSDRQYRRALPPEEAIAFVRKEAGHSFDPDVVAVLVEHYQELERKVKANAGRIKDIASLRVTRGKPAAGFEQAAPSQGEKSGTSVNGNAPSFLDKIAAARLEVLTLFELTSDLGSSLSLQETLSVLATRLKRLVPFDSLAIYFLRGEKLIPEYVTGENFRLFASLEIPYGQGLSGWVAERRQPILNGNPSVEPGYLNDPTKFSTLRSALAVPLEGAQGVVGVLSLYHADKDAFSRDHLRILNGISAKLSNSIENALRFHVAETTATTDYLTGLPNARSLFPRLEEELSRCRRMQTPLELVVCDLNGFKQVNDRFGHLEGNRVLREVAERLRENCRDYDFVARMGGDEFVIVMPGVEGDNFHIRAAQLSQLAADAGRMITGENILSCAVGFARFPEDGADSEQLLSIADQRMYRNKYASRENADPDAPVHDRDGWPQAKAVASTLART